MRGRGRVVIGRIAAGGAKRLEKAALVGGESRVMGPEAPESEMERLTGSSSA